MTKLTELKEKIKPLIEYYDDDELRQMYKDGDFVKSDRVKDLNKRYRWDVLALVLRSRRDYQIFWHKVTHEYNANRQHVDTILRQLIKPL